MTDSGNYRPDIRITALGEKFFDPVAAADFPETTLRYRNDAASQTVGLDGLSDAEWISHFGRFEPLPDNLPQPLALRYHGHQFHHYNKDIGDGRGFLFAQLRDDKDRLLDLGTKGSGQTPFSRSGDGRLTLLGGVREVLATTYLQSLGVNTSKSFSLIETGEALQRNDEPSPTRSAVLTRLSHSHIRFGTFQRAYFEQNTEGLEALVSYCLTHFYEGEGAVDLFNHVVKASMDTVASWMAAGFVHGVMNTDNMNITGESFDYGPYRFLPTFQPGFTAAYFDHNGLYAFGRQPEAMTWNLGQLAQSLSLICDDAPLLAAMQTASDHFQTGFVTHMFRRLGLAPKGSAEDIAFVRQTFEMLDIIQTSWPQFFHDWQGGAGRADAAKASPARDHYQGQEFTDWLTALKTFESVSEAPTTDAPASLLYEEIGALWEPIDQNDDWSAFHAKLASFKCAG